jgi:hypothetical protein
MHAQSPAKETAMGLLSALEHAASSVTKGIVDGAKDLEGGAKQALTDAWNGAVNTAKTMATADLNEVKDVADGFAKGVSDFGSGLAHGDPLGGLGKAAKDVGEGTVAAISDGWHGLTSGASELFGGINAGVHEFGSAAQKAYTSGVDGMADGIGDIAGHGAADLFRSGAMAVEQPFKQAAQFSWGVTEGVAEGVGGAIGGIGNLVGDGYRFATDSRYRSATIDAVERGATYVAEHPLGAAEKVGSAAKNLAVGIYEGGVAAAKKGDLAEYLGKGVGQIGVQVATIVFVPEAEAGEGVALAGDLSGAARGIRLASEIEKGADAADAAAEASTAGRSLTRAHAPEGGGPKVPDDLKTPSDGGGPKEPGGGPKKPPGDDDPARADLRRQLEIKNDKALAAGQPAPYPNLDSEVESRLAGWNKVREQGFPNGFADKATFDAFKQRIVSTLEKYGAPTDDIGVHGSAVSKLGPKDIDVGIRVDQAQFNNLVERAREIKPGSLARIDKAAEKGILPGYFQPTVDGMTFPTAVYGAAGDLKLQISFILKGGDFDIGPYLKF